METLFPLFFIFCLAWVLLWIGGSIIYRRVSGKPVFPRVPSSAVFAEAWRSGNSLKNVMTRLGGARNCLLVYVADHTLTIVPVFPFNLMFLPEIYGLEITAPISEVQATQIDGVLGKRVRLTIGEQRFDLWLNHMQAFREALEDRVSGPALTAATSQPRSKIGWRVRIFQVFALVWGAGACVGGYSGLMQDLRFRSNGVEAMGKFVGSSDTAHANGIVQYEVSGRRYTLTSIQGSGLYEIGGSDKIRYLPRAPASAREEDYLGFDLLFAGLGSVMLIVGVTAGWIGKRFGQALNLMPGRSRS